jgi:hypothetical protein
MGLKPIAMKAISSFAVLILDLTTFKKLSNLLFMLFKTLIRRGGYYFVLTQSNQKSSQDDRCHYTGYTPGRAP